jgi:hypothetical protein
METISKKEACEILKIKNHTLSNLIKSKNILISDNKELVLSSIIEYKKELDERRNITSPQWINHGGYGSI